MSRVLIYTLSTGTGHNKIANYIKKKYEKQGHEVTVLDFFKDNNKNIRDTLICKGYDFILKYFRNTYNFFYKRLSDKSVSYKDKEQSLFLEFLLAYMKKSVIKNISTFEPDLVVCTHVFPAYVLSELNKNYDFKIRTYAFITDLYPHPFWQYVKYVDKYFILTHTSNRLLENLGIDASKINRYRLYEDIQNNAKFVPKNTCDDLLLIIMAKNANRREFERNLASLAFVDKKVNAIVLCGGDMKIKKICDRVAKGIQNTKVNIHSFLYMDNEQVKNVLAKADVVISKVGINAFYEILKNSCVLIPFNKIAYNEKQNREYLKLYNMSPTLSKNDLIAGYINNNFFDKDNMEMYRKNIEKFLYNNFEKEKKSM